VNNITVILIINLTYLLYTYSLPIIADNNGCHPLDHEVQSCLFHTHTHKLQACDELCKQSSHWYGHCDKWDGSMFSCTCFAYVAPLDGHVCSDKQTKCDSDCVDKGMVCCCCFIFIIYLFSTLVAIAIHIQRRCNLMAMLGVDVLNRRNMIVREGDSCNFVYVVLIELYRCGSVCLS
jgi:hypothetical protein